MGSLDLELRFTSEHYRPNGTLVLRWCFDRFIQASSDLPGAMGAGALAICVSTGRLCLVGAARARERPLPSWFGGDACVTLLFLLRRYGEICEVKFLTIHMDIQRYWGVVFRIFVHFPFPHEERCVPSLLS